MKKIVLVTVLVVFSISSYSFWNPFKKESDEVNVYTDRHYDTDQELYDEFTEETGIKVNVLKAKSDELITRIETEGENTNADVLITADAGRLYRAKEKGLFKEIKSKKIRNNVPDNLRDSDNLWTGLTKRARIIVYAKDRVNPDSISSYEDLTKDKWKGKVLIRSSSNIYNQSLFASFISLYGKDKTEEIAREIKENFARDPKGNDRDQAKGVVAGIGDVAILNTYYIGKMLNSKDPEEVKVAKSIGIIFPDKTHVNISGAGIVEDGKNNKNALKLLEFLTSKKAQRRFATANYEYPVNPKVEPSDLLKSWGDFKDQGINLSVLGELNSEAAKIFDKAGWK